MSRQAFLFQLHLAVCSSAYSAATSTSPPAAAAPPPAELLADADENDNLFTLPRPRRAACRAASLVAPRACATSARLTARCSGVCSAMAISL